MLYEDLCQSLRADFVEKIKPVIAGLEAWNEYELHFRRLYELQQGKEALSDFVGFLEPYVSILKEKTISPEYLEQDKNGIHFSEDLFLLAAGSKVLQHKNRNVFLTKHLRYMPGINHKHDFFEIFFVLRGQCIDTIAGKRMVLPAGSLCFIAPETYHITEVYDDSLVLYLLIKRSTFDEVFVNLLTAPDVLSRFFIRNIYNNNLEFLVFNIANDTELLEHLLAMLVEQGVGDKETDRIMEGKLLIFFSLLRRKYGESPLVYEQASIKQQHWEIIAYIDKHFRRLTHANLAKKFNLSISYCSRIIKSITGKNFSDIVLDLSMSHARNMLSQSDMNIGDISFSLGYKDQGTFLRNFKKVHGITPGQYRRNNNFSYKD